MSSSAPAFPPRVAIVLVNWNGWRECVECIDSVLAQAHRDFHIFIVDNDSQDQSLERIAEWCAKPAADAGWRRHRGVERHTDQRPPAAVAYRVLERADAACVNERAGEVRPRAHPACQVTLIRSGGNGGYAAGCNVGIAAAGLTDFAYFWFLNPDTAVDRCALSELICRAESGADLGIVGSTLLFYDRPDTVFALAGGRLNSANGSGAHLGAESSAADVLEDVSHIERDLSWVCGASMLVSARYVRDVGVMQEDYFLYYEEADWAIRGAGKFKLGFAPQSIVYHKSGANSSKVMPLFTAGFYYRSRLRFVSRFWPERMAAARRQLFLEMLKHVARGRWAAARLVGATVLWTPDAPQAQSIAFAPRYELLDGLRGVACLGVLLHHLGVVFLGHYSVMVFFVISGYCITASAQAALRTRQSFGAFMWRRLRRIYPPYLAALLLFWLTRLVRNAFQLSPVVWHAGALQWLQNLTLTQWVSDLYHPVSLPGENATLFVAAFWSLNYEEQFYVLTGLCMILAVKNWVSLRDSVLLLLGVGLVWDFSHPAGPITGVFIEYWPHFALGSSLYFVLAGQSSPVVRNMFLGALASMTVISLWHILPWQGLVTELGQRVYVELAVLCVVSMMLVWLRPYSTRIARSRFWPPIAALGLISYSLYLIHQFNLHLVATVIGKVLPPFVPDGIRVTAKVGLHLLLATAFWFVFERPFLNRPRRLQPRR